MFYFEDTTTQTQAEEQDDELVFLDRKTRDNILDKDAEAPTDESPEKMLERIRKLM